MSIYNSNGNLAGNLDPTSAETKGSKRKMFAVIGTLALAAVLIGFKAFGGEPAPAPDNRPICEYTVEANDTLSGIANKTDTSVDRLLKLNHRASNQVTIIASDVILTPCTSGVPGKPVATASPVTAH